MINLSCLRRIRLCMALAMIICSIGTAHALTLLDTGVIKFEASGSQFGRLARNGVPSDWFAAKPFPGVLETLLSSATNPSRSILLVAPTSRS